MVHHHRYGMTMKAAVLKAFGSPLTIETLPDPVLGTGEVIIDVVTTRVLPYANEVFSGARQYLLDLPLAPGTGAIGRVRAVGPDATRLTVGDWVCCDPTVRSRDDAVAPDILLQGWSAGAGGPALRLQQHFRHGSFAEQMLVPTENAIRVEAIDAANAARWCALGTLLVPYGGLLAGNCGQEKWFWSAVPLAISAVPLLRWHSQWERPALSHRAAMRQC